MCSHERAEGIYPSLTQNFMLQPLVCQCESVCFLSVKVPPLKVPPLPTPLCKNVIRMNNLVKNNELSISTRQGNALFIYGDDPTAQHGKEIVNILTLTPTTYLESRLADASLKHKTY